MTDPLELHIVAEEGKERPSLALILLGEKFHEHSWLEQQGFIPAYTRVPTFGGDGVEFHGGPYRNPEDYGTIVVNLGAVLLKSPHLNVLQVKQDRLLPYFLTSFGGLDKSGHDAYTIHGPQFVENVVEAIRDATNRYVHVEGDPQAFDVQEFRQHTAEYEELSRNIKEFGDSIPESLSD